MAAGFTDYLEKPLDVQKFVNLCKNVDSLKEKVNEDEKITSTSLSFDGELKEVFDQMIEGLPDHWSRLKNEVNSSDTGALKGHIHELKGVLSCYGFEHVAKKFEHIESKETLRASEIFEITRDLERIHQTHSKNSQVH